ncbi:MAG: BTAD domain-containing putative transcriptional regulator [Oscillospiraceae bacterium]
MTDQKNREFPPASIKMLGGFEMTIEGHTISDTVGRTYRLWNLLEYLIANRNKFISQEELIVALWPEDNSDNPTNALKNLIYRIRTTLTSAGISCAKEMIVYHTGAYHWNNMIVCDVDHERFDHLAQQAQDCHLSSTQRINIGLEALALYRGDFLPLSAFEQWVVPLSAYYHAAYLRCALATCELLLEQQRYDEIYALCTRAFEIDRFEESLHYYYIKVLLAQGKAALALEHYNYVNDLFYRELGVRPTEGMRRLYREIAGTLGSIETDLNVIKDDLNEKENITGAFYCNYEVFKNMYRIEARAAARTGQTVFIGLLTVTDLNGEVPQHAELNRGMEELLATVLKSLRRGDVIARFSATQYVLMLPTLTYENGEMVLNRICKRYRREYCAHALKITASLKPLEPIP